MRRYRLSCNHFIVDHFASVLARAEALIYWFYGVLEVFSFLRDYVLAYDAILSVTGVRLVFDIGFDIKPVFP